LELRQAFAENSEVDCKTVRIFAYSSTREQSIKRSGLALRACEARARKTLTPRFTDFFTDFEKKPTVLQSNSEVAFLSLFTPS